MTDNIPAVQKPEPTYPSTDGLPFAETYDNFYALVVIFQVLKQYLSGRQATVLANQFFYYVRGYPNIRLDPDLMVIFDVALEEKDIYTSWSDEEPVPSVIFEITCEATKGQDRSFKKSIYEQLSVPEYWIFDPKGEWMEPRLIGYRLQGETYEPIKDNRSEVLQLRLEVEGKLIAFYREDTGEKLLTPDEMAQVLQQEVEARKQAEEKAKEALEEIEKLKQRLYSLGVEPNTL
ncbi:MAG: Uma2 family endonuclease [Scytonematopsis contorta HA4267-MV1]|jgi:Uma2 family endonuclease|nr:Uma2 family endonuclease [Scytonematopsis contorta HA4267-MV1]